MDAEEALRLWWLRKHGVALTDPRYLATDSTSIYEELLLDKHAERQRLSSMLDSRGCRNRGEVSRAIREIDAFLAGRELPSVDEEAAKKISEVFSPELLAKLKAERLRDLARSKQRQGMRVVLPRPPKPDGGDR